jgi:hypothetical protein
MSMTTTDRTTIAEAVEREARYADEAVRHAREDYEAAVVRSLLGDADDVEKRWTTYRREIARATAWSIPPQAAGGVRAHLRRRADDMVLSAVQRDGAEKAGMIAAAARMIQIIRWDERRERETVNDDV